MEILKNLSEVLQVGDQEKVKNFIKEALSENIEPGLIFSRGLLAGMDVIGEKFKKGEIFIPHVLLAARAMHAGMDLLKPILVETGAKPAGKFIMGTVLGDHHDIGKNLVIMMLEGKGFEVTDLGMNVAPEKFIEAVKEDTDIIGMSALLSTTRPLMADTIKAFEKAGIRDNIKIMVGGGAVNENFSEDIGADAYGQDATSSAEIAMSLVSDSC